jgi:chaperone BCS1
MIWMDNHQFRRRNLTTAIATTASLAEIEFEVSNSHEKSSVQEINFEVENLVNYRLQENGSFIKLRPHCGSRLFQFRGNWILFIHLNQKFDKGRCLEDSDDCIQIKLQCLGNSLHPLQIFLQETQKYSREISVTNTGVYRAVANTRDILRWSKAISRPSRNISTVILDKELKSKILRDINGYLHPQTSCWYANHGIPYRRGYLFSGPPGTGKTSLASAIAGVFGLDIYVISLQDATMTESQFLRLFSEVPSRCIVLLEDIDVAGLTHSPTSQSQTTARSKKESSSSISLATLLNAIDGVGAQEGRILIMTTNAPRILDKALIRPGRVDLHIKFELPRRQELEDIFLSMYRGRDFQMNNKDCITTDIVTLSQSFANALPEGMFSLAEIQGFLLQWRSAEDANRNVGAWVEEVLKR